MGGAALAAADHHRSSKAALRQMQFLPRLAPALIGGAAFVAYYAMTGAEMAPLPRTLPETSRQPEHLHAVVVGATGATGRQLIRKLCAESRWASVTAVTRRSPASGELYDGLHAPAKLHVQVVEDLEAPEHEASILAAWSGAHVLFNTIGTTRSAARSAAAFKHVEIRLTERAADLGRRAGIPCASVVSASGANAGMYVDPWELVHPLLYMQTLGRKEQMMVDASFAELSVFRPGMLNRLKGDRLWENTVNSLALGLRVDELASAMEMDAVAMVAAAAGGNAGGNAGVGAPNGSPAVYEGNTRISFCSKEAGWRT